MKVIGCKINTERKDKGEYIIRKKKDMKINGHKVSTGRKNEGVYRLRNG